MQRLVEHALIGACRFGFAAVVLGLFPVASAAEFVLPADERAELWDSALTEVSAAVAVDLTDALLSWKRTDAGWELRLRHDGVQAVVTGLVPGETHAQRVEQLYLALSRLKPPQGSLAERLTLPRPPPDRTPAAVPADRVVVQVPPEPQPEPQVDRVIVHRIPSPVEPQSAPNAVALASSTLLILVDTGAGMGGALQSQARWSAGSVGARLRLTHDARLAAKDGGQLPVSSTFRSTGLDALAVAEAPLSPRLPLRAALRAGGSWRTYGVAERRIGNGLVPVVAAGLVGEVPTPAGSVRLELGWTHDLRAVRLVQATRESELPGDQVELAIGWMAGVRR